jgi:hypothetical protein
MRLLMMSPHFHHLNLIDSKGSKVLIEQLVQKDRYCDASLVCTKGHTPTYHYAYHCSRNHTM